MATSQCVIFTRTPQPRGVALYGRWSRRTTARCTQTIPQAILFRWQRMMLDRTRSTPEPRRRRQPPPGYESYGINWAALNDMETAIIIWFADALREIREHETELMRITIDRLAAMGGVARAPLIEHNADGRESN